eukprot:scaffold80848_cov30-Tisochrysis_lutea.AAC.5
MRPTHPPSRGFRARARAASSPPPHPPTWSAAGSQYGSGSTPGTWKRWGAAECALSIRGLAPHPGSAKLEKYDCRRATQEPSRR